jgi:flagellar motor component MotA
MNLFILENENQKKENIITSLKKQITKMREKEIIEIENEEDSENNNIRNNIIPNEIYIIAPSTSVNLNDLMLKSL